MGHAPEPCALGALKKWCNRRMPAAVILLKGNICFFAQKSYKTKYLVWLVEKGWGLSLARQVLEESGRMGESK
jgi:hypothetical protein